MKIKIPPLASVVSRLKELSEDEIKEIAQKTEIGASTIWKIRCGYTKNPGIETVRQLVENLPRRKRRRYHAPAPQALQ